MIVFEELFRKSNGQPVVYNGQMIHIFDRLRVKDGQVLKVTFESVRSEWRQGISLSTDGYFEVNNQQSKQVVLWQDTAPREVFLTVRTQKGECALMNVWDTGSGLIHKGHNGAAMIVEVLPYGRRYRCNDGFADDDFDDLVFRVESDCQIDNSNALSSSVEERWPREDDLTPISRADLKALFDHLDRPNPSPCTHTFKETTAFLKSQGLPVEQTVEWLRSNGACCDCEVIFNTDAKWGEWAGRKRGEKGEKGDIQDSFSRKT